MALGTRTIEKFIREALVTTTPLTLGKAGLAKLKLRLETALEKCDEIHFRWQERPSYPKENERYLCDISVKDPRYEHYWHGYGGFSLVLDAQDALYVSHGMLRHPVGSEDQLFEFLRLCRERGVRLKGQHAKRGKVRNLRTAAIMAKIQYLARTLGCDYTTYEGSIRITVGFRFDGEHVVQLDIPYAKFQEHLAQLESALPMLRDLARTGVNVSVMPRFSKYSMGRRRWVLHQTLANGSPPKK